VEDKEQHVTCIVELNKLKIVEAVTILEAQTVMVVAVVGYIVTPHRMHAVRTGLSVCQTIGDSDYIRTGKTLSFNFC
jgi:ribosomal protein L3